MADVSRKRCTKVLKSSCGLGGDDAGAAVATVAGGGIFCGALLFVRLELAGFGAAAGLVSRGAPLDCQTASEVNAFPFASMNGLGAFPLPSAICSETDCTIWAIRR